MKNPLWQHLTQAQSLRFYYVFWGDIFLVTLVLFGCSIVGATQTDGGTALIFLQLIAFMVWIPLLLGAIAAFVTIPVITSDRFELILLTPLSDWQLVRSFVWASFYRFRVFNALAFICTPAMIINLALAYQAWQPTRSPFAVGVIALGFIGGIWSLALWAVAVGVALGMITRSQSLTLMVVEFLLVVVYTALGFGLVLLPALIVAMLFVVVPLVTTPPVLWVATRTLRRV